MIQPETIHHFLCPSHFFIPLPPKHQEQYKNLHQPSMTATVVKIRCGNKFNFKNKSLWTITCSNIQNSALLYLQTNVTSNISRARAGYCWETATTSLMPNTRQGLTMCWTWMNRWWLHNTCMVWLPNIKWPYWRYKQQDKSAEKTNVWIQKWWVLHVKAIRSTRQASTHLTEEPFILRSWC